MKQPDILFGRTGQELPCLRLCSLQSEIIATHTGPDGGLTTVNRGQRGHVTSQDPDVSYIDSEDDGPPPPATILSESTSNDGKLNRIIMGALLEIEISPTCIGSWATPKCCIGDYTCHGSDLRGTESNTPNTTPTTETTYSYSYPFHVTC